MVKVWSRIDRFLERLLDGSAVVSGFFIFATALLITYEVVMRYVFAAPTLWTFDVTVFLIIYAAFVGSAFNVKEGKHVKIEFLINRLAKYRRLSLFLSILSDVVVALFWIIVTWRTLNELVMAYKLSEVTLSYLRFPLTIPLAAICLGGLLILLQLLRNLVRQARMLTRNGA